MPAANEYPVLHLMSGVPDASCKLLHFMSAKRTLHLQIIKIIMYVKIGGIKVREDKLSAQSMDFAVMIIQLVKQLKSAHESIISNQIGRSGTSIGANIREARYAHGKADFISKLQIALKEANETGYWIELLYRTDYISEDRYKTLDSACTSIRVLLISSINTAKQNAQ